MKTRDRKRIRCGQRYYLVQDHKVISGVLHKNQYDDYKLGLIPISYWLLKCLYSSRAKATATCIRYLENTIRYHKRESDKHNGMIKLLSGSKKWYKDRLKKQGL